MFDKTRKLDGTLAKKARKKRITSAIGIPFIAAGIGLSAPLFNKTAESRGVSKEVIDRWMDAGHPMMKEVYQKNGESECFAKLETDDYLKTREADLTFKTEFGYDDEQCRKCAVLETDVAKENRELASKAGIDEELAQAVVYQESDMNGVGKNGKVKRSPGGGYNEWQVTYQGFKEFWKILTKNKEDRYKPYLNAHSEEISEDRDQIFRNPDTGKYLNKKQAWKKVKTHKEANRMAGKTLLKFFLKRENGDIFEALRDYNSGEIGKKEKYKEDSIRYAESVLKYKKFFETVCPEMKKDREFFRKRHYDNQKSFYIASNVPNGLNYHQRRN